MSAFLAAKKVLNLSIKQQGQGQGQSPQPAPQGSSDSSLPPPAAASGLPPPPVTSGSVTTCVRPPAPAPPPPVAATPEEAVGSKRIRRYASYARQGPDAHRPNYIVERAAPSMLFLCRAAQVGPYLPLTTDKIKQVAQPLDYSLRPQPHVSEQAIMDLYRLLKGHYGITLEYVSQGLGGGSGGAGPPKNLPTAPGVGNASLPFAVPSGSSPPSPTGAVPYPPAPQSLPVASATGAGASHTTEDYRIAQIKRNARHIDNHYYHRICSFYNTKEGCRRGDHCDFLHVTKEGTVVNPGR